MLLYQTSSQSLDTRNLSSLLIIKFSCPFVHVDFALHSGMSLMQATPHKALKISHTSSDLATNILFVNKTSYIEITSNHPGTIPSVSQPLKLFPERLLISHKGRPVHPHKQPFTTILKILKDNRDGKNIHDFLYSNNIDQIPVVLIAGRKHHSERSEPKVQRAIL